MTIEDGLKDFFSGSPYPLSVGARVWNSRAPQQAITPYVVFYRVGATPRHSHGGRVPKVQRRYQFSAWATSQSDAQGIADTLRRMLDGFTGSMGDVTVASVFWAGEFSSFDETAKLHQVAEDFEVTFTE